MSLILASGSAIRHSLLLAAGVAHRVDPSSVDKSPIKAAHDGDDAQLALALAQAKAVDVSARLSGNWVIGADSLVSVRGRRYGKPGDRAEAAAHLAAFSGQPMMLTSAVVLARNSRIGWQHADSAILHVRKLER